MCGVHIGFARMRKVRLGLAGICEMRAGPARMCGVHVGSARICEMRAEPARGKTDNLLIQIHGRSTHE